MNIFFVLGLVLSGLIGLSLGLIGGGGSIITVPVLVYVIGVEAHDAVGMSLAVVGATSLFGAFLHSRRGTVNLRIGFIFGAAGIVGAFLGSPLTRLLSPSALMLTFAVLMLVVAVLMLRRQSGVNRIKSESDIREFSVWKALLAGFGVGLMTGFLGVGGGFLIVPSLALFGGLDMKEAVGTSLFVIFLNCVAGLLGHISQNNFDWNITLLVSGLAVTGAIFGSIWSHRITADKLKKGFAVFVLTVAFFLLAKNYNIFIGGIN